MGICRCVVVNLIALGICFQQVNVVGVVGLLLDRGQVYVLHGDGSLGLSCRNGDGNHITQPCGVIFIGKQCKVECCVLGFCFCQGFVDRHINGSVRCLYPDADLCRLCYHDSIAQNVGILIGVREAVPCDVFLTGLCYIAGNGCGNFDNNFIANLDGRILQLDPEVHGIRRGNTCPVHDIVQSQPVLGIFIQSGGFIRGIAIRCICSHICYAFCSTYSNRINALESHAKGGISGISGNQTQVSHIGQTVDNGHVFQIYRRVILDVEFIGHIFALHALYIVVGGLAAVAGIVSRVRVGCAVMSVIGVGNRFPGLCGQANDIIVCIVPDLCVALFAGNRIFCGERLCHFCIASVGDNAFFFLAVFYSGGELYDDGIVRLQFSFCNACSCHTGNIPADGITVGSGFDFCAGSGNHTVFVHVKAAVCLQRHYKIFCSVAGVVKFIAAGKIICQRHISEIQPAQFFPVQGSLASGICFALAVIEDCLPDQGIAGSDIAVFYLLEICVLIVLSGIGSYCKLGEAGGGYLLYKGHRCLCIRLDVM